MIESRIWTDEAEYITGYGWTEQVFDGCHSIGIRRARPVVNTTGWGRCTKCGNEVWASHRGGNLCYCAERSQVPHTHCPCGGRVALCMTSDGPYGVKGGKR